MTETKLLAPCSWSGHDDRGLEWTVGICARLEGSSNHFGGCVYGFSPRGPLHAVHWMSCQLSFFFCFFFISLALYLSTDETSCDLFQLAKCVIILLVDCVIFVFLATQLLGFVFDEH